MYFIRTKKNKYDIDVIIDVTADSTFKSNTSLEWKDADIASPGPIVGHYWLNDKSIALDSTDYSEVQAVINSVEEPLRVSREAAEVTAESTLPEIEVIAIPGEGGASARAEFLNNKAQIDLAKNAGKSDATINDPVNLDSPENLVSTTANYDHYVKQLADIDVMVAGLSSSSNYTLTPAATEVDQTVLTFDPPLVFQDKNVDGTDVTVTDFVVPPGDVDSGNDISDYIQYWTDLRAKVLALKDKMKTDLGL